MKTTLWTSALLVMLLSGCAWLAPEYHRPEFDIPEPGIASEERDRLTHERLVGWWQQYHDSVLHQLIDRALTQNDDLAIAAARLNQSRAMHDYTHANRFPLLSISGYSTRTDMDFENSDLKVGQSLPSSAFSVGDLLPDKPSDLAFIGGMLSYEVDLWGKLASANEAAKAAFLAATYGQDTVRLSVISATAQLYFNLLALDAAIKITKDTIMSRAESYEIYKSQYDHEIASGLVLRQSQAELEAARAQLPRLLKQKDMVESSLAVLLGSSPREIMGPGITPGKELEAFPVPPLTPEELPSNLLAVRPDIAAAEQALIASNFDIGVARAAYFPSISLSSLYGISDIDIDNLYSGAVPTWQLGASLAGPVIDFGRTSSGVALAEARNEEQFAVYRQSVRTAFKEVKDALSSQVYSRDEEKAQSDLEEAVKEALRLADLRYAAGYSSYIEVLDAQRNLYSAQIALVGSKLNRLTASVNLYKALGGGWQQEPVSVDK